MENQKQAFFHDDEVSSFRCRDLTHSRSSITHFLFLACRSSVVGACDERVMLWLLLLLLKKWMGGGCMMAAYAASGLWGGLCVHYALCLMRMNKE